jgi:hypothetical protein
MAPGLQVGCCFQHTYVASGRHTRHRCVQAAQPTQQAVRHWPAVRGLLQADYAAEHVLHLVCLMRLLPPPPNMPTSAG